MLNNFLLNNQMQGVGSDYAEGINAMNSQINAVSGWVPDRTLRPAPVERNAVASLPVMRSREGSILVIDRCTYSAEAVDYSHSPGVPLTLREALALVFYGVRSGLRAIGARSIFRLGVR